MAWNSCERGVEVEPSIYAADFPNLRAQFEALLEAGVRVFHVDVGDGCFIDSITLGPIVVGSISPVVAVAGGVLDCHLMVAEPERHFEQLKAAGGTSVTFHVEATAVPPRRNPARAGPRARCRRRLRPRDAGRGCRSGRRARRSRPVHEHPARPVRTDVHEDSFCTQNQLEAYERLIHDAMIGDRTLFTTPQGIERRRHRCPAAVSRIGRSPISRRSCKQGEPACTLRADIRRGGAGRPRSRSRRDRCLAGRSETASNAAV